MVLKERPSPEAATFVYRDKATGVNYLFVFNDIGGGVTVLVDADGKPLVTGLEPRPAAAPIPQGRCPRCGMQNDGMSAFCMNCGTRLQ